MPKSPSPAAPQHVLEGEKQDSESPAPTPLPEEDEKSKELQEDVQKSKEDEVALGLPPAAPPVPTESKPEEAHVAADNEADAYASALTDALEEHGEAEEKHEYDALQEKHVPEPHYAQSTEAEVQEDLTHDEPAPASPAPEPESQEVEDEEDAAARRQRIAERLRQQGGFNPFSAPVKHASTEEDEATSEPASVEATEVAPPPVPPTAERRQSVRRESHDSNVLPESPASPTLARRTSQRKSSVSSATEAPPVPVASRPDTSARRDSAASVKSAGSEGSAKRGSEDGNGN